MKDNLFKQYIGLGIVFIGFTWMLLTLINVDEYLKPSDHLHMACGICVNVVGWVLIFKNNGDGK